MKKLLILLPVLVFTIGCNAQQKSNKKEQQQITTEESKPQVSWKVNKKYDDKGNLIGYDSTYTWTYSSKGGKVNSIEVDSVMTAFKEQFNKEFPSLFNKNFGNPVWSDSLLYRDFVSPDYFSKRWEQHFFDIRSMMKQMDSLRNSFLQKNYPGLSIQKKQL